MPTPDISIPKVDASLAGSPDANLIRQATTKATPPPPMGGDFSSLPDPVKTNGRQMTVPPEPAQPFPDAKPALSPGASSTDDGQPPWASKDRQPAPTPEGIAADLAKLAGELDEKRGVSRQPEAAEEVEETAAETPADTATTTPPTPPSEEVAKVETDAEIDAAIASIKGPKELKQAFGRTKKELNAVRQEIAVAKAEKVALETKLKDIEEGRLEVLNPKVEALQKERDEALERVRILDYKNHPEYTDKFIKPYQQTLEGVYKSPFAHSGNGLAGVPAGVWYVDHCRMPQWVQGLKPLGAANFGVGIATCNDLTNASISCYPYVHAFNFKTNQSASYAYWSGAVASQTFPENKGFIMYGNVLYSLNAGTGILTVPSGTTNTLGCVIANNLIENNIGATAGPICSILAGASLDSDVGQNYILAHNTFVGQRENIFFNWNNGADINNPFRVFNVEIGNIMHYQAVKEDDFTTRNARRTNNWSFVWGVNSSGNLLGDPNFQNFTNSFPGLKSTQYSMGAATFQSWMGFVTMGAADPYQTAGTYAGNGDYHLTAGSPAVNATYKLYLPFDITGKTRTLPGAAGVFEYP